MRGISIHQAQDRTVEEFSNCQSSLMSSYLDLLLGNPQYAIFCGVTLFTIFVIRYSLLGYVTKFPVLNPKKSLELTSNRATQDFIADSKNILTNGRALYKDQPYRAYTDWGKVVVIPPKFLDALKSHKQLDFTIPAEDVRFTSHSGSIIAVTDSAGLSRICSRI